MFDDFLVRAMLASVGVALAAAPLGCFVIWRRMAYFGDATAHAAVLGIALSLTLSVPIFAGVLVVLVIFLGLLRPIFKTLASTGSRAKEDEDARQLAALEASGLGSFDELSDETVTLHGGEALALPGPEESYEHMLNSIKGLVAEDPGRVSQVIKRWINTE